MMANAQKDRYDLLDRPWPANATDYQSRIQIPAKSDNWDCQSLPTILRIAVQVITSFIKVWYLTPAVGRHPADHVSCDGV